MINYLFHSIGHFLQSVHFLENFHFYQNISILHDFNPFPNKPLFLRICSKRLLKTLWEKEKLLVTSNFSFSHSIFYSFGKLSAIFIKLKILVCKTLWVWKSLELVVWERVKFQKPFVTLYKAIKLWLVQVKGMCSLKYL